MLPGHVSIRAAASCAEVEGEVSVRGWAKLCAALWRLCGGETGRVGGRLGAERLPPPPHRLSLLAKGLLLPLSLLRVVLYVFSDKKRYRNTVVLPHLRVLTKLCTSPAELVPQGLRVSSLRLGPRC